jgi:hypothetical protein
VREARAEGLEVRVDVCEERELHARRPPGTRREVRPSVPPKDREE